RGRSEASQAPIISERVIREPSKTTARQTTTQTKVVPKPVKVPTVIKSRNKFGLTELSTHEFNITSQIFDGLTCAEIRQIKKSSPHFNSYIQNYKILEKARDYGYPRKSNHAKIYIIDFEVFEDFINI